MPLISIRNLCRSVAERKWLLQGITAALHQGETVALSGPSGSGKTVLLRALAMLDPIDTGHILWRGQRVRGAAVPRFRAECVYLAQMPQLPKGSVESALRAPFALQQHRDKAYSPESIHAWLGMLGRDPSFLQSPAQAISGGESQLVAILRALQLQPSVLLLDEPTAAMDASMAVAVEQLIQQWLDRDGERAAIWTSHDTAQLQRVADRRWTIADGSLIAEAPP